jgi:hypothetical protein
MITTLALAAPVQAQDQPPATAMDGRWHFTVAPYFWMAGLEGTVSVAGVTELPVEASFSQIIDHFDLGLLAHFEARQDRWGIGTDLVYLNLGADVASARPILGRLDLEADVRQTLLEGFGFYRAATWETAGGRSGFLDALLGARYVGTSAKIDGTGFEGTKRTLDWVDGMVGLRLHAPLGSRFGLLARADVAGLGSDFTWNLQADLTFHLSRHWALGAGYRYFDVDYDSGTGLDRKLYDVTFNGPLVGAAYTW